MEQRVGFEDKKKCKIDTLGQSATLYVLRQKVEPNNRVNHVSNVDVITQENKNLFIYYYYYYYYFYFSKKI